MKIILASGSPRRRELLSNVGLSFAVISPEVDEDIREFDGDPRAAVLELSRRKAQSVADHHPDSLVIAADTLVSKDGALLGKPVDRAHAAEMLGSLSGNTHEVYTGVALSYEGKTVTCAERTKVRFRPLEKVEIDEYIATGEPMDKAGAYGIQNIGATFVEAVDGDYFNVVGLPLCALFELLKREFGIQLFDVITAYAPK